MFLRGINTAQKPYFSDIFSQDWNTMLEIIKFLTDMKMEKKYLNVFHNCVRKTERN